VVESGPLGGAFADRLFEAVEDLRGRLAREAGVGAGETEGGEEHVFEA